MTTKVVDTLWKLSEESSVDIYALAESQELANLINAGVDYPILLEWVKGNF